MNQPVSLVKLAHSLVKEKVKAGDFVVDATAGNGRDTAFLAQLAGTHGKVFAFDIQPNAIVNTRIQLQTGGLLERVTLIQDDHANMRRHIPESCLGKIRAVMFNLGYLPGSDKHVVTQPITTLAALNDALEHLAPDGMITVLAYPGHAGGETEAVQVAAWCDRLNPAQYRFSSYESRSKNPVAPRLYAVTKIAG